MTDLTTKNPRIKQGWLRVILFGLGFIIITLLISIPLAIGLFYSNLDELRADPTHAITSLLQGSHLWEMVLLEFVVSIVTVWIFRKFIDRRDIASLGLQLSGFTQESIIGFFIGPALVGLLALLLMATGRLQWVDITFDPSTLFISLGMVVLIAFSEELVFRGYVLSNLLEAFSNKWVALLLSALCFAIFHFSGPGITPLAFANLFLAGILLGVNYIFTRNLWFSFFLHLSWNFFLGPILGSHISGLSMPTLLVTEIKGDWLVTGGDFGIEGSVINTALSLIAILVLSLAFERKYSPTVTREIVRSKA
ncbi:MAG TPA: CPBP family intramembrane glutamic endopeptidase [Puia sp.]|jgi:membrane protease YdiL (CAAX protease family)|nr:CPBP family intramembrane glutamic endopeptidase [Puia sp.]